MKFIADLNNVEFCDKRFFLWVYVSGLVYLTPLSANQEEIKQTITAALQTATQDMLQRVREDLENRNFVCRVSGIAHIEHL